MRTLKVSSTEIGDRFEREIDAYLPPLAYAVRQVQVLLDMLRAGAKAAAPPAPAQSPRPAAAPEGGGGELGVGSRVLVRGRDLGFVRYMGEVHYARGEWLGVVLDEPKGKNNGLIKGQRYFEAPEQHGMMVRSADVALVGTG
mmetsp:Transcript_40728/g.127422  ORF Transcript_40728/g.127422 Transcript_40728/m.127422 type:complete len:142 (+) Transcript_40728:664-1089(+)